MNSFSSANNHISHTSILNANHFRNYFDVLSKVQNTGLLKLLIKYSQLLSLLNISEMKQKYGKYCKAMKFLKPLIEALLSVSDSIYGYLSLEVTVVMILQTWLTV